MPAPDAVPDAVPGTQPDAAPHAVPDAAPDDRYGRPAGPGRRRLARVSLGVAAAAGLALAVWLGTSTDPVSWEEVGYSVDGSTSTEITFDLTKDTDATAVCQVQALNANYTEVGVQSVTVGPAGTRTQRVTMTIATAEEAVTAVVESCELG